MQRVRRLPVYPVAIVLCMVFGLFIRREALAMGFFADDYAQIEMLEGNYPVARKPYDLFDFSDGTRFETAALQRSGFYPWWADPEVRITMLRPLASLMTFCDHQVFGRRPFGYHLHSTLWWLAMLAAISVLLRRTLPIAQASLAFLLVVCSIVQSAPLWWVCNRSVSISTTFSIAALLAYMRYREGGARPWLALAVTSFSVAFGFGEYAFCGLAYLVAYEARAAQGTWKARTFAVGMMALPAALFVVVRAGLHVTIQHSGVYVDPFLAPLDFLHAIATRAPILVADLLFVLRADHWIAGPPWLFDWVNRGWVTQRWIIDPQPWRMFQTAAGLVACVGVYLMIRFGVSRASWSRISWLVLGCFLSIIPVVASFPSSRLLVVPLIGFSALVSSFIFDSLSGLRTGFRGWSWRQATRAVIGGALLGFQLVVPVIMERQAFVGLLWHSTAVRDAMLHMDVDDARLPGQDLVLLTAFEGTTSMYLPATRRTFGKSVPRSCMYLSYVRAPYRLTRESTHAFRMELGKDAVMLLTALEHMLRAPDRPLRLHETVDVGHFRATILELANGLPKRVRFAFDRPLDDPSLLLMVPEARGFRRFELPAIGTSTWVPAPAMPVFVPGS